MRPDAIEFSNPLFYYFRSNVTQGHGLSGHKSVDGPPQLLAEYAYYVAELVEALQWGDENGGDDVGAGGSASTNDGSDNEGSGRQMTGSSFSDDDCAADNDSNSNHNNKIILVGHSMGSGVAVVLCAAFPEWFSALVLLEGGLVARNADDASRHVRAACQRRLRSNRTLFPNANVGGGNASPSRARVYGNLDAAIRARLSTTERMPGDQSLSYEAARDMVLRATVPAPAAASTSRSDDEDGPVVFRHDPRLQWPSLQYYTREQVEAFMRDVRSSDVPVCSLWATDGWPVDAWAEAAVKDALRPSRARRLGGSHHFHADPDTVGAVAGEVFAFLTERKL
ncbi:hypothetical protein ACHAW5_004609 [Stephanodiscus triporus]|uniref:AB hydrolase-1 domain-containing protein n=1 Tax=Stephanodiscus triporus TaxID=2934178 RepID=A0ABD3QUB4_9STRA